jgi:peptide methionine sulfoxide reductase MsrB
MNMKLFSILIAARTITESYSSSNDQCFGYTPMPSVSTYLGATLNYQTSERICCNNHRFAEYAGYLAAPEVDLFSRLDPTKETIFYDSVCGLPLFIAPRGRTFEEFKKESLHHGWPSFRPEEMVSENVVVHPDGRMESICLTHLGHNLPQGGMDRYCIDLVCIAGEPLEEDDERVKILSLLNGTALERDELNTTLYESSAETFSGNYSNGSTVVTIILYVGAVILVIFLSQFVIKFVIERKKRGKEVQQKSGKYDSVGV